MAAKKKSKSKKSAKSKKSTKKKAVKKLVGRRIVVRGSKIHGRGVFAAQDLPKGTLLIEYTGKRITSEEADEKYGDDESPHTFLFLLNNDMVVDANYGGNSSRFINHSCSPNCEPFEDEDERLWFETKKDIKKGEELTWDYQLVIEEKYTPAIKKLYQCFCGSKKCRGNFLAEK